MPKELRLSDLSPARQALVGLCQAINHGPSKKLLELVTSGRLYHGGHPVLRWNASCLTAKEQNDNLMFTKPERSTSSSRIDGIAATVNALARAMVAGPKKQSVYQTRGIRSVNLAG